LIGRGVDAIIVSSLSGAAVYNAYEAVAAAGVPLIIFASGVPYEADIPYTCYVATDDVEIGRRAGEYVVRRMEGNGRLAILEGIRDSTNNRLRMDGLLPVLGAASGIVVAGMDSADWLRRPAQQAMSKMLASTWPIDAVLALNDEMALGALDALRGAHRDQDIFVVGLDGQKEALQEIRTGGPFVMTIRNEWDGAEALRVAIAAARGEQVARRITLDATLIDAHNVEALFDPSATC
jgi:ABC-type sugar transport system substrate-binding protein